MSPVQNTLNSKIVQSYTAYKFYTPVPYTVIPIIKSSYSDVFRFSSAVSGSSISG